MRQWIGAALLAFVGVPVVAQDVPVAKQRLLVLTDIEADPDDTQSLVRLLLYANEIDWRDWSRPPRSTRSGGWRPNRSMR